jgi:hypothetical protein
MKLNENISGVACGTADSCTWCGEQQFASSETESNMQQCLEHAALSA